VPRGRGLRRRRLARFGLVGPVCVENGITDEVLERVADELAQGPKSLDALAEAAGTDRETVRVAVSATGDGNIVRIHNGKTEKRIIWIAVFSAGFCWAAFAFLVYRRYVLFGR
jgi:hypothetical protein